MKKISRQKTSLKKFKFKFKACKIDKKLQESQKKFLLFKFNKLKRNVTRTFRNFFFKIHDFKIESESF